MSFGFGFALPHWQTLSGGFTPASLFSSGEQGAWYDPSDLTTLFQDSAGTTPVTAVEQSVGLMLDKSKGGRQSLPITGWVKDSGDGVVTVNGGTITITGATTTTRVDILAPGWAIGNLGDITINGTVSGAVSPFVFIGGSPFAIVAGTNTYRSLISGSNLCRVQVTSGSATFDITSRGVVQGNHAYQSTSASRPVLRARYNLLTWSEQFDNAAWNVSATAITRTANTTTAPNGTLTADSATGDGTNALHYFGQVIALSATVTYTLSFYAKANGVNFVQVFSVGGTGYANFNITAGAGIVGTSGAPFSSLAIQDVGDGWYRCSCVITNSTSSDVYFALSNSATATRAASSFATSGGIYLWGAQLIVTNSLLSNAYQRIAAATDYDTSGFLPYLAFDGTDDSLLTNSVDFSATDKMTVWAGVRKLSDAAFGVICETSGNAYTTSGGFGVLASGIVSAGAFYATVGNGSSGYAADFQTYTAPITNVCTGIFDIAQASGATEQTLNVNALSATRGATAGTTMGTGNFGNYPLYIGRRNNATLPFNGNIYSLIIRGAQSSAAQISSTETWVNGKTAAY